MCCKKNVQMIPGIWTQIEVYQILGKDSQISLFSKKKPPKGICVVQWETDKDSSDYQTRSCMARSMDRNWERRSESRKTRVEKREAKTRECPKIERHLFHRSGRWKISRIHSNARIKLEGPMDAAMPCKRGTKTLYSFQESEANSCEPIKIPKTLHACIVDALESTRQRLESSLPKNTKITLLAKDTFR